VGPLYAVRNRAKLITSFLIKLSPRMRPSTCFKQFEKFAKKYHQTILANDADQHSLTLLTPTTLVTIDKTAPIQSVINRAKYVWLFSLLKKLRTRLIYRFVRGRKWWKAQQWYKNKALDTTTLTRILYRALKQTAQKRIRILQRRRRLRAVRKQKDFSNKKFIRCIATVQFSYFKKFRNWRKYVTRLAKLKTKHKYFPKWFNAIISDEILKINRRSRLPRVNWPVAFIDPFWGKQTLTRKFPLKTQKHVAIFKQYYRLQKRICFRQKSRIFVHSISTHPFLSTLFRKSYLPVLPRPRKLNGRGRRRQKGVKKRQRASNRLAMLSGRIRADISKELIIKKSTRGLFELLTRWIYNRALHQLLINSVAPISKITPTQNQSTSTETYRANFILLVARFLNAISKFVHRNTYREVAAEWKILSSTLVQFMQRFNKILLHHPNPVEPLKSLIKTTKRIIWVFGRNYAFLNRRWDIKKRSSRKRRLWLALLTQKFITTFVFSGLRHEIDASQLLKIKIPVLPSLNLVNRHRFKLQYHRRLTRTIYYKSSELLPQSLGQKDSRKGSY
jgi:hypothetical protein